MIKQLISARFYTDKDYESLEDMCKHEKLKIPELNIYGQRWHCAPFVRRVIISPPATIILWQDDTKTVCKCSEGDEFDAEKGIAMCFLKKMFGNPSQVRKFIDKWMKENSVECSQHLIEGKKSYTGNATKLTEEVYMADYSKLTGSLNLVFCKDCKWYEMGEEETYCRELGIFNTDPTSYCSYARRKEE